MEALEDAVEGLRVGDPLDESTQMGPLISAGQREQVAGYVNGDAPVAIRGSAPDGPGYWFPPTVLCPVANDDRAAREEIFGPVACVIPFNGEAEAVALANDTIYGLSGSIWTRDGARALRVSRALETGVLSVNSNTSVRVSTPFGGFKQSGVGRELGPHALDHYTEVKSVYISTDRGELMAGRLEGKVCVITGAASGIGAETAAVFADEGATVVGVDLAEGSPGDLAFQADVSFEDDVKRVYDGTREAFGRIDVLFNNAGINPNDDTSVLETSVEAWQRVQDVNLRSVFLCCKHGIPHLLESGRRIGHQHGVVRRRHGRRRVADLLHRLQGRRPRPVARAGYRIRPPRRARQRALPGAGRDSRCCWSCSPRTRSRRPAAWSTSRWAASASRVRSPTPRSSWPATSPPT
jgi:NAD(P)-dependent dehydrogenase (short-subunit alcohol dehydrogenase family)